MKQSFILAIIVLILCAVLRQCWQCIAPPDTPFSRSDSQPSPTTPSALPTPLEPVTIKPASPSSEPLANLASNEEPKSAAKPIFPSCHRVIGQLISGKPARGIADAETELLILDETGPEYRILYQETALTDLDGVFSFLLDTDLRIGYSAYLRASKPEEFLILYKRIALLPGNTELGQITTSRVPHPITLHAHTSGGVDCTELEILLSEGISHIERLPAQERERLRGVCWITDDTGKVTLPEKPSDDLNIVCFQEGEPVYFSWSAYSPKSTLDIIIPGKGKCHGRVLDMAGDPIPGIALCITNQNGYSARTETDIEGRFEFDNAGTGPWRIWDSIYDYPDQFRLENVFPEDIPVTLAVDTPQCAIPLRIRSSRKKTFLDNLSIQIDYTDEKLFYGNSIQSFVLDEYLWSINTLHLQTDPSLTEDFHATLRIEANGHYFHEAPLESLSRDVPNDIILKAGNLLTGSVVDEYTGLPLRRIRVLEVPDSGHGNEQRAYTDDEGKFQLMTTASSGHLSVWHDHFINLKVDFDERSSDLGILYLSRGARITGKVYFNNGKIAANEKLEIFADGRLVDNVIVDPDGGYQTNGLRPATVTIRWQVNSESSAILIADIPVSGSQTYTQDLMLPRTTLVNIRLSGTDLPSLTKSEIYRLFFVDKERQSILTFYMNRSHSLRFLPGTYGIVVYIKDMESGGSTQIYAQEDVQIPAQDTPFQLKITKK